MADNTLVHYRDFEKLEVLSSAGRVLVVRDPLVFKKTGIAEKLSFLFKRPDIISVDAPQGLLETAALDKVYRQLDATEPILIVGVGGGTVLDTVKLLNVLYSSKCVPENVLTASKKMDVSIPMVMIPTTAGTGSEATHFAVFYRNKTKVSVASDHLLPAYVILDPDMVITMPKNLAVSTGFDAFSQAIESYWSIHSTEESKKYSRNALMKIRKSFVPSVLAPDNKNRAEMQLAAYYAGKAINIAKTTAAHSISYPLTSFFKVPHGLAVFLTLPSIFEFNNSVAAEDCTDSRGPEYVIQVMKELTAMIQENDDSPVKYLTELFSKFHLTRRLSSYGVTGQAEVEIILENGFNPERMVNNPRRITRKALKRMLMNLL